MVSGMEIALPPAKPGRLRPRGTEREAHAECIAMLRW